MTVIAFGAHPDDVELYAGGLVAGLARRGAEVHLIDLTAGELGTRGTVDLRREEADAAAEILGVASRSCLGLPDGGLRAKDEHQLRAVTEAIRRHRPRLIIAPWHVDPHPDHGATAGLVRRAHFWAGVVRFPANGEPCRPGPIVQYEQKTAITPDLVVDITADVETKRAAVRAFRSQFFREPDDALVTEISEPSFHEMLAARERVHGARIGVVAGEGYRREGPHPVLDPLALLAEEPGGEDAS